MSKQKFEQAQQGERTVGKVVKLVLDKGFGFIQDAAGKEYFFHRSAVRDATFETLQVNQPVNFEITSGQKGLRAEDIHME